MKSRTVPGCGERTKLIYNPDGFAVNLIRVFSGIRGSMSDAEWKNRCGSEWGLLGAPLPDGLDWKSVYEAKPFGRNLLRNPSPYGTALFSY